MRRGLLGSVLVAALLAYTPLPCSGGINGAVGGGSSSGPPQPPCVGYSQALRNGACSQFVGYFRGNPKCGAPDPEFVAEVNKAPAPSDACCSDAQTYINNGCNCDQQTLSLAQQNGVDTSNVPCVARAVVKSRCNNGLHPASC